MKNQGSNLRLSGEHSQATACSDGSHWVRHYVTLAFDKNLPFCYLNKSVIPKAIVKQIFQASRLTDGGVLSLLENLAGCQSPLFYNIVNPFWKLHVNYNCKLIHWLNVSYSWALGLIFLFLLESVAK